MRRPRSVATAIVLLLCSAAPACAAEDAVVAIDGGQIRGEALAGGRVAFRGVPFAAAPVGPLRWKAPAPVVAWQGVREAVKSAPACAQLDDGWNKANADFSSEDCLYLEVGTPALKPAKPMPVIVWIHGGSNKAGGGAGTIASSMVDRGVVLVSIQYRLGPLGFMAHPALSAEAPWHGSGNYGLMDQQAALRWVQRNIAKFGGDPRNVTIAGESAGAQDVGLQQLSPLARGLFHKAIEESGTASFGFPARDLKASEAIGEQLAAQAGAQHASAAELRALPPKALLEAARRITVPGLPEGGMAWLQTTIDGHVITEPPAETLARGGGARVTLIIGSNAREIDFFPTPEAARSTIRTVFGARADQALGFYGLSGSKVPEPDPRLGSAPVQVGTDIVFSCPAAFVATARSRVGVPVWQFLFDYAPAGGSPVSHASELRYVFGAPGEDGIAKDAPAMQAYWANFAKTGDPNGPGLPSWPSYGAERRYLTLGAGAPVPGAARRAAVCDLIQRP